MGKGDFPQFAMGLNVLAPGEPMAMYHWENDQEDFLVLSGEAVLIIEGEERPLRQWDFVHCPPGTKHVIVGAGESLCIVFAIGSPGASTLRPIANCGKSPFPMSDGYFPRPGRWTQRAVRAFRTNHPLPAAKGPKSVCSREASGTIVAS